jgi:cytochrome c553
MSDLRTRMKAAFVVGAMLAVASASGQATAQVAPGKAASIARGKYLTWAVGCNDCHTPKKMGPQGPELDLTRLLSGSPEGAKYPAPPKLPEGPWIATCTWDLTAWSGPWGISYATNLTPDQNTGMGIWTEDMFVKAIRTGRHFGTARPILPPMPWQDIKELNDEDLKAIFAYLKSLPPIANHVPEAVINEPPPGAPAAK